MTRRMLLLTPAALAQKPKREPDVGYLPSSQLVVEEILSKAKITKDDVLYDLGCGDGRVVITAAKVHGARGVGVDLDPKLVREARDKARTEGVEKLASFREGDIFDASIADATIVYLYLLPAINRRLRPKLQRELKAGSRVVSHYFDMGQEWKPERIETIQGRSVYFWTV